MPVKKPEEFLHLRQTEIAPIVRKLNAFIENVREDMDKKMISEADGKRIILKATILVSMLTQI